MGDVYLFLAYVRLYGSFCLSFALPQNFWVFSCCFVVVVFSLHLLSRCSRSALRRCWSCTLSGRFRLVRRRDATSERDAIRSAVWPGHDFRSIERCIATWRSYHHPHDHNSNHHSRHRDYHYNQDHYHRHLSVIINIIVITIIVVVVIVIQQ